MNLELAWMIAICWVPGKPCWEVWMTSSIAGAYGLRQMACSGHLPSIWAHSPMVVLERMSIERLTLALVATAAAVAR